jgi:flagellar biosynthesis chaperone FliJ
MVEDINREIERLNGNATEASQKLADMGSIGVSPEQIEMLQSLIEKRDELLKTEEDKQQRQKAKEDRLAEMQAAANDVKTAIETVQQSFAKEQQRLQTLVDAGMLSRTDADKFLAKNPKFAQLMQGADSEAISGNMRGNVAKDLRSAEGAGQLYSLINGTVSNEAKQIALLTEMRDEARKARIDASKRGKAVKI